MNKNIQAYVAFFFLFTVLVFSGSAHAQTYEACENYQSNPDGWIVQAGAGAPCDGPGAICEIWEIDAVNGNSFYSQCQLWAPPPSACADKAGQVYSSGIYDMGLSENNEPANLACDDGCQTSYSGMGISFRTTINGLYHYGAEGSYTFTGEECNAGESNSVGSSPTPPETSCDPVTQVEGVIAGKTVCFTKGNTETQTDVTIDPVTGDRVTTTTTTNPDLSTTTTTTVTTDPVTGSTSESTSTVNTPAPSVPAPLPGSFCDLHPTDPTCQADSSGPVDPAAGEGDCALNPNTLGCATIDGTITGDPMSTEIRDIALIAPVSIGGVGQCPAPLTASFLGQTVEMSFDPLCQFANSLRPVVLVLAWLAAGVIFIGGVRS